MYFHKGFLNDKYLHQGEMFKKLLVEIHTTINTFKKVCYESKIAENRQTCHKDRGLVLI